MLWTIGSLLNMAKKRGKHTFAEIPMPCHILFSLYLFTTTAQKAKISMRFAYGIINTPLKYFF